MMSEAEAITLRHGRPPTPGDLADLLAAFNEVTGRLQATHETLRREVSALRIELRDAHEQLARSRRLAALGEMAAGIAHEVRNPLSSIRLYARLLEQDLGDRPAERATAMKIGEAVLGLDAVVGDVLAFARELKPRPTRLDASGMLTRALEACRGEVPAGVRVDRADREGAVEFEGDPGLVHRALVNVIRNALQAMEDTACPPGGHVLMLGARIEASERKKGLSAVLVVRDTGPGVSREFLDRMFNPFFTTRASGTGLGLAIVHRIMDAHGGRVTAAAGASRAERGAEFELHFPLHRGSAGPGGGQPEPAGVQEAAR
jgi:signal transduction histidine kinase